MSGMDVIGAFRAGSWLGAPPEVAVLILVLAWVSAALAVWSMNMRSES